MTDYSTHEQECIVANCPTCGQEFSYNQFEGLSANQALELHQQAIHRQNGGGFDCMVDWCNRNFEARTVLSRHLKDHPEENEVDACPECGILYSSLGLHFHHTDHRPDLPDEIEEIILGLVLGDGSIQSGKGGRESMFTLIMTNREFLEWLDERLAWFSTSAGVQINRTPEESAANAVKHGLEGATGDPRNHKTTYRISSRAHPRLSEMRNRLYPDGEKIFPSDLKLTPLVTKMWYISDGGLQRHKNARYTLQFATRNENHRHEYLTKLFEDIGFDPSAPGDHAVQFGVDETRELLEWMGDPPPGFEYKWDLQS